MKSQNTLAIQKKNFALKTQKTRPRDGWCNPIFFAVFKAGIFLGSFLLIADNNITIVLSVCESAR